MVTSVVEDAHPAFPQPSSFVAFLEWSFERLRYLLSPGLCLLRRKENAGAMQFGHSLKCNWEPCSFIDNARLCHYALDALGVPLLCAEGTGLGCSPGSQPALLSVAHPAPLFIQQGFSEAALCTASEEPLSLETLTSPSLLQGVASLDCVWCCP